MGAEKDRSVLNRVLDASLRFRGDATSTAGFFLALSAAALYLLLLMFAEGGGVRERLANLEADGCSMTWFIVLGAIVLRILWAVGGSRITVSAADDIARRPDGGSEGVGILRAIRADLWDTPFNVLVLPVLLFLVTIGLLQAARIQWVGKPFLFVLLPIFILLSFGIVRPVLRWLFAGHLIGAGLAIESDPAFPAQSTAFGWLKSDPVRVIGLRLGGYAMAIFAVGARAAGLALLGMLIRWVAPEALSKGFGRVLLTIAVWWTATLLVSALYSLRAAQYLVLRRALDGVDLDAASNREGSRDLTAMGLELVKKLESQEREEE